MPFFIRVYAILLPSMKYFIWPVSLWLLPFMIYMPSMTCLIWLASLHPITCIEYKLSSRTFYDIYCRCLLWPIELSMPHIATRRTKVQILWYATAISMSQLDTKFKIFIALAVICGSMAACTNFYDMLNMITMFDFYDHDLNNAQLIFDGSVTLMFSFYDHDLNSIRCIFKLLRGIWPRFSTSIWIYMLKFSRLFVLQCSTRMTEFLRQ
jgi:hypothetical protein